MAISIVFGKELPTATKLWDENIWTVTRNPFTASGMLLMNTMYLCASQAALVALVSPVKPLPAETHSLSSHTGCLAPSPAVERCLENQVSTWRWDARIGAAGGFPSQDPIFQGIQAFAPCKLHSLLRRMCDPTWVTGGNKYGTSLGKGCSCCLVPRLETSNKRNGATGSIACFSATQPM